MKKILVGYIIDGKTSGIDKYLLSVLEIATKSGVKLDFLTNKADPELKAMLSEHHSELFEVSTLKNPLKHYRDVKRILESGNYDTAYFNISEPLNMMGARAAKKCKVRTVIHSHNSKVYVSGKLKLAVRMAVNRICKRILYRYGDLFLACSGQAGQWLYPDKIVRSDKFHIIFNAVDTSRFFPDTEKRSDIRKMLGIDDGTVVLGHIGSFSYAKNNFFLIDIMKEVKRLNENCILLSAGVGDHLDAVKQYANQMGVADSIRFLGARSDTPDLYRAMDVFLLPSRFEGLPIVAVEAQLSSVACVLSKNVDRLTAIAPSTVFLDISDAKLWAKTALEIAGKGQPPEGNGYTLCDNEDQIRSYVFGFGG